MTSITKSFIWSFLEQGGSKLIAMIVQIVLARILAPDAFGVLAIMLVVTQIADSIAQSGLGLALIQKSEVTDKSYSTGFWLSLGIALFLYAIIFLSAPLFASFYNMPDLEVYLRVLALVVIFNALNSIQRSYLQRSMDFKKIFKVSLIAIILSGILGITFAYLGFGVWSLVAQTLSQGVFTCIAMFVVVPWKPSLTFNITEAKELFNYGWKICITGILGVLYTGISELVIGKACSTESLGYYSQGRKYPQAAITVMTNAISNVLFPAFSSIKDNLETLQKSLKKALSLGTFIVFPISILFAVTAEPLVALLLTDKWLPCVPIFQMTCASNALLMFQLVNLRSYMALGDSSLYMRLQIIKVCGGGAIICATAIITQDIYATAFATALVGILSILIVDMQPAKRMHGYGCTEQLKDQIPIFILTLAATVFSIIPLMFDLPYVVLLILQIAIYCCVFLFGAKFFHFKELDMCISLLKELKY